MAKIAKEIYWGSIEYVYSERHSQYAELKGGFVYAFFFTEDVRGYIKAVENCLAELKLDILKVEFVNVYDLTMEWENETDGHRYMQIAKKAKSTKLVVFDEFYAYYR